MRNVKHDGRRGWLSLFPPSSLSARPLLRREALSLSFSLFVSLCSSGSVENERWRILGSTEVKRWILPSIFKFRIERRQTKGTNATNEKGETEAHGSRTLLPWLWSFVVITFFQFEGEPKRASSPRFRQSHTPSLPAPKISFLSPDFPSLRVAFFYIFLL